MLDHSKSNEVRQSDFIWAKDFVDVQVAAPLVNIVGGEAATVSIGLATDANDVTLAKVAATNRTGATGVQIPPLKGSTDTDVIFEYIGATNKLAAAKFVNAGDVLNHWMLLPLNWDLNHPIDVVIWWTSAAAAVGDRDITWKFLYAKLNDGDVIGGAHATALDTVLLVDAPKGTANTIERTQNGIIDGRSFSSDSTQKWMGFSVEMDAFDAAFTEAKYLLGIEFLYTQNFSKQRNRVRRRARDADRSKRTSS